MTVTSSTWTNGRSMALYSAGRLLFEETPGAYSVDVIKRDRVVLG